MRCECEFGAFTVLPCPIQAFLDTWGLGDWSLLSCMVSGRLCSGAQTEVIGVHWTRVQGGDPCVSLAWRTTALIFQGEEWGCAGTPRGSSSGPCSDRGLGPCLVLQEGLAEEQAGPRWGPERVWRGSSFTSPTFPPPEGDSRGRPRGVEGRFGQGPHHAK